MTVSSPTATGRGFAHAFVRCALCALLVAAGLLLAVPGSAVAVSTGSGGWYWPVGTEDFQGWDGYWVFRSPNHSWHMAQDMPSPVGHAVYAVGDGVILESEADKGYDGVLVVLHRTLEGAQFKAVYGHISRASGMTRGARVKAGQVIGRVNNARHAHFGVHPGKAYPPDRNPYRGHTYDKRITYGWVDPVAYLRANPRTMAYRAPALPRVTSIAETVAPTYLGVAQSSVYYSVPASEGVVARFRRPLLGGARSEVSSETTLPPLDRSRFTAVTLTRTSFAVVDRLPRLSASYSTVAPAWRCGLAATGTLTSRSGAVFCGAPVALQRLYGSTWKTVAIAKTGPHGRAWLPYVPERRCQLRLRFVAPSGYVAATSSSAEVAPRPGLKAPRVPSTVRAGRRFEIEGTLRARHAAGARTATLQFMRKQDGRWVLAFSRSAVNHDIAAGTAYERYLKVSRGDWLVRALCPADSLHAAETTRWVRFSAR